MVFPLYCTADLIIALFLCDAFVHYCISVFYGFVFCISLLFIGNIIMLLGIVTVRRLVNSAIEVGRPAGVRTLPIASPARQDCGNDCATAPASSSHKSPFCSVKP